jgi:hypothetical protein
MADSPTQLPQTPEEPSVPQLSVVARLFKFFENGFVQTAIGITGGLMAVFVYGPILTVCAILALVGLHRSGATEGLRTRSKVECYMVFTVISGGLFFLFGRIIEQHRDHIPTVSEITSGVIAGLKGGTGKQVSDSQQPAASVLPTPATQSPIKPTEEKVTLELAPLAWLWRTTMHTSEGDAHGIRYGLVAILRVYNHDPVTHYVRKLEVVGDAPVTYQEYQSIFGQVGHSIFELGPEWTKRKPFCELSWIIWPGVDGKIDPGEERFIPFVVADPESQLDGWGCIPTLTTRDRGKEYIGYKDTNMRPPAVVRVPSAFPIIHFLRGEEGTFGIHEFRDPKLNDEVVSGAIRFRVGLESNHITIKPNDIRPVRLVFLLDNWRTGPILIQDLFYARDGGNIATPVKKDPEMGVSK